MAEQEAPRGADVVESGDLTAHLHGAALDAVRWRGLPVLDRVYAAARDVGWGTASGQLVSRRVVRRPDRTTITATVDHAPDGIPLAWQLTYTLRPRELDVQLAATAHGTVTANRLGWCLLHPLSQVGSSISTWHGGRSSSSTLPGHVAPQPVDAGGGPLPAWGPFDRLELSTRGLCLDFRFHGELFETEDQRNWTDASFKTYAGPLSGPRPLQLRAGDEFCQQVTLSISPGADRSDLPGAGGLEPTDRRTAVSILLEPRSPQVAPAALRDWCDRIRVELDARLHDAPGLVEQAARHGDWELQVRADEATDWDALRALLLGRPPRFVLVLPAAGVSGQPSERTSRSLHAAARTALAGVVECIGGGTTMNFAELQRYPVDHLDALSWTWSPTVHDRDPDMVWGTLRSYPAIVATARRLAPQAKLCVGPLRDATNGLPEDWLPASARAWLNCGLDSLCIARYGDLVSKGRLTPLGHSVAVACRGRNGDAVARKGWQ